MNDVVNIKKFFETNYDIDETMVLTDDRRTEPSTDYLPTRKNIIAGFKWLVRNAKAGDSLLLHYSGHGGKVKNTDGTEASGYDQTVIPLDYEKAGHIIDDDVHDMLCKDLPKGVRLTAIFDCCHSESIMDLPYIYNINGNLEIIESDRNQSIAKLVAAGTRYVMGDKKQAGKMIVNEMKDLFMNSSLKKRDGRSGDARAKAAEQNTTQADIVMFSGCKDDQTSADTKVDGEASGAMSYALIKTLTKANRTKTSLTYTQLLRDMREVLEGRYTQVPCLSAGRRLVLDHPFMI